MRPGGQGEPGGRAALGSLLPRSRQCFALAILGVPSAADIEISLQQEKTQQGANVVDALCERALGTGMFEKDVEGLVALYDAKAGFLRREADNIGG